MWQNPAVSFLHSDLPTTPCRTKNIVQAAVQKRNSEALSAMTFAATLGDVDSMEHLLQRGLLINTADYDGRTTLHLAALEGNVKVLELLLQEGADPNVRDRFVPLLLSVAPFQQDCYHQPCTEGLPIAAHIGQGHTELPFPKKCKSTLRPGLVVWLCWSLWSIPHLSVRSLLYTQATCMTLLISQSPRFWTWVRASPGKVVQWWCSCG